MKRHAALQDLSRDHHFILAAAIGVEKAQADGAGTEAAAARLSRLATAEILPHMREEEDVVMTRYVERTHHVPDDAVKRVRRDHATLREGFVRLAVEVEARRVDGAAAARLSRLLAEHVRFEERVWFEAVQTALGPHGLELLAADALAFRRRWRGDAAIGPREGCPF